MNTTRYKQNLIRYLMPDNAERERLKDAFFTVQTTARSKLARYKHDRANA